MSKVKVSVVMPCLNEAETLGICINKAQICMKSIGVVGEVVIADNGSTDGSIAIAESAGARIVHVPARGYGNALLAGIKASKGEFIIMGDADDSYDFSALEGFIQELETGADLVMGNRFMGGIAKDAMPVLHKYIGNPVLSFLGRFFYNIKVRDFHCGLRGFRRESIERLELNCGGMEFASEMVVKSSIANLNIVEIPATLSKDGRSRPPHIRTFRDGWRHLVFLFFYSPKWLFLYPGLFLTVIGVLAMGMLLRGPVMLGHVGFDVHTMLFGGAATIVGLQMTMFSFIAKQIGVNSGVLGRSSSLEWYWRYCSFEGVLLLGISLFIFGLGLALWALGIWAESGFGAIDTQYGYVMRISVFSVTLVTSGMMVAVFSCLMAALENYSRGAKLKMSSSSL